VTSINRNAGTRIAVAFEVSYFFEPGLVLANAPVYVKGVFILFFFPPLMSIDLCFIFFPLTKVSLMVTASNSERLFKVVIAQTE